MEFVVGDIVVIDKRTEFTTSGATWIRVMDTYVGDGFEYEVTEVRLRGLGVNLKRCDGAGKHLPQYVWPITSLRLI